MRRVNRRIRALEFHLHERDQIIDSLLFRITVLEAALQDEAEAGTTLNLDPPFIQNPVPAVQGVYPLAEAEEVMFR